MMRSTAVLSVVSLACVLALAWAPSAAQAQNNQLYLNPGNSLTSFPTLPAQAQDAYPDAVLGTTSPNVIVLKGETEILLRDSVGSPWIGNLGSFSRTGGYWVNLSGSPR